jgi:hypothetical protein
MFGQLLTAFQGFFSRAFWFGAFLPVAVGAGLHLAIADLAFPDLLPLDAWLEAGLGDKATSLTLLVVGLVIVAYILGPFPPLIRSFLDGTLMPDWLHDWLRRDRHATWQKANEKLEIAKKDYTRFERIVLQELPAIRESAKAGNATNTAADLAAINNAKLAIDGWQTEVADGGLPQQTTVANAIKELKNALEKNASFLPAGDTHFASAEELAKENGRLTELLAKARDEAHYRYQRAVSRYFRLDLYATRAGDARWQVERYTRDTYHGDFDYIWTRVEPLLKNDTETDFSERLSDARALVDFSVLTFALTFMVPLIWLPILLVTESTPWLFLAVGLSAPFVLLFLFELVVRSQIGFGEIVRVAIDQYRLDVLTKMLHQRAPATLAAERALWTELLAATEPGNPTDLSYRYPTT